LCVCVCVCVCVCNSKCGVYVGNALPYTSWYFLKDTFLISLVLIFLFSILSNERPNTVQQSKLGCTVSTNKLLFFDY
jgi:hypothetical protein